MSEPAMSLRDYRRYVDAFNRSDFVQLARWFDEDAVFEHLPHLPLLRGRDAILDFYREVKARVEETITPIEVFVDDHGIAAEIEARFVAKEEWRAFPAAPLQKGDVYRMTGVVFYWTCGQRFRRIRGVARLSGSVEKAGGQVRNLPR